MILPRDFSENTTNFYREKSLVSGNANKPLTSANKAANKDANKAANNEPTRTILSSLLDLARLLIWAKNYAPQKPS
jgi:hypothetical protein